MIEPTVPSENTPNDDPNVLIAQQIQAEYDALVAGTTTTHTTWTITGAVLDMSATQYNNSYGNYNVKLIIEVGGIYFGVYNGFVNGCSDEDFPWSREGDFLETKYPYVVHAEQNAILNARGKSLEGCRIYVNLFPCHDCARNIIQSGIKKVYYLVDKYADTDSIKASKYMFEKANIELIKLTPKVDKIEINFNKK